jgi:hypothetical protein
MFVLKNPTSQFFGKALDTFGAQTILTRLKEFGGQKLPFDR